MNVETMNAETPQHTNVNARLWIAIVISVSVLAYLLGFVISSKTGVEPGFFEQPEAGGYGAAAEKKSAPGLDEDLRGYYEGLSE